MMFSIESRSALNARRTAAALKLRARAAIVVSRVRAVAPYALMELILPGGSVMALLLWLYRRQTKVRTFATDEILALL
jgi:hypothetical protein